MLGIGPLELLILAGIGLMVMGPEKFPAFAKMAVRFMGDLRSYMDEVRTEVSREIRPVQQEMNKLRRLRELETRKLFDEDDKKKSSSAKVTQTGADAESDPDTSGDLATSAEGPAAAGGNAPADEPARTEGDGAGLDTYPEDPPDGPTPYRSYAPDDELQASYEEHDEAPEASGPEARKPTADAAPAPAPEAGDDRREPYPASEARDDNDDEWAPYAEDQDTLKRLD